MLLQGTKNEVSFGSGLEGKLNHLQRKEAQLPQDQQALSSYLTFFQADFHLQIESGMHASGLERALCGQLLLRHL